MSVVLNDEASGSLVWHEAGFMDSAAADVLFARLMEAPFVSEGSGRSSVAFGDAGLVYRYAGVERQANGWPDFLRPVAMEILDRCDARFNFALCNLYPNGRAWLGWHSDDEPEISGDVIASLSLGAARDFDIRRTRDRIRVARVALGHGSLLVMSGRTQRNYQHCVPKRTGCDRPRINLTFRRIRRRATSGALAFPGDDEGAT